MGDFNAVYDPSHRGHGRKVSNYEMKYWDCISASGWLHPNSIGHWFTWNNKGVDSDGQASRIDHCFINKEWIHQDFNTSVQFLNPHISNHCPLLVSFEQISVIGGRPFRYFNYLSDHPEFFSLVQQAWSYTCRGNGLELV